MSTQENMWKNFHQLYTKYCGISDEYRMLKERWKYLQEFVHPLYSISGTFNKIDNLVLSADELFRALSFERTRLETYEDYTETAESLEIEHLITLYALINLKYTELSALLGALKRIFLQRTSSLFVRSTIVGVPSSPERTIGNEIMNRAIDKLTYAYLSSLRLPDLAWDGITSFLYPTDEPFGGFCRTFPETKIFHIAITEDGKYFLGDYLTAAHEAAHVSMMAVRRGRLVGLPRWLKELRKQLQYTMTRFNRCAERDFCECTGCEISNYVTLIIANWSLLEQSIADLIATKIGGICTAYHLLDFALELSVLPRVAFLVGYHVQQPDFELNDELDTFSRIMKKKLGYQCQMGDANRCVDFLVRFGEEIGFQSMRWDMLLPKALLSESSIQDCCSNALELPCIEESCTEESAPTVLSHIVANPFVIRPEEETSIERNLKNGKTCLHEDPRKIIHVYYKLYRNHDAPSYVATLNSLALNECPISF